MRTIVSVHVIQHPSEQRHNATFHKTVIFIYNDTAIFWRWHMYRMIKKSLCTWRLQYIIRCTDGRLQYIIRCTETLWSPCRWLPMFWRNLLPPSSWDKKEVLVFINQPTEWCHVSQGQSLNINFCTNLRPWTFTALTTYLIHNAIILQCHTFIADIKQLQCASVPDRQKRVNHRLQHILFSLSKVLATCCTLNQSVMRPLHEINSRYNKTTCQHMVCRISH
jgi:hypothetical protein